MSESIILLGGGGHAKVIIDCARAAGMHVAAILDDTLPVGSCVQDVPVLGPVSSCAEYASYRFILAIGNNAVREKLAMEYDLPWATVVHPSAVVSPSAKVGAGTVVMPCAVINAEAVVGAHCIINSGAIVEHDNVLADYVHISPRAALGGTVTVGKCTHIGIGACVKNNVSICEHCVIGAGCVAVKNIEQPGTYVGVPAGRLK